MISKDGLLLGSEIPESKPCLFERLLYNKFAVIFMIKILKNKNAQVIFGEYGLAMILVISAMAVMGVYFKRTLQARIHDTRNYMVKSELNETAGYYDGNFYVEYEPYYMNTVSTVFKTATDQSQLVAGGVTGIYRKNIDDKTSVKTFSITAPPKDAQ